MKKTIFLLLVLMPLCAMAQQLLSDKNMYWTNGDVFFVLSKHEIRADMYVGMGGTLNEGGTFFGLQNTGNSYKLVETNYGLSNDSETYMYGQTLFFDKKNITANLKTIKGKRYLLFYEKGKLLDVYHEENETTNYGKQNGLYGLEESLIRKIFLAGEYIDSKGGLVTFAVNEQKVHGLRGGWKEYVIDAPRNFPLNNIRLDETTTYEVNHEDDGLMLTEYYTGEEDFEEWKQTGNTIKLYHVLPNRMQGTAGKTSRFDFASKEVLYSSILGGFTKKELRLMRNEIYARHGYRFSSPDMNEYFSQCPWYSPRGDNNAATAELTEVEKINVQLIKKMEKTPQY